MTRVDRARRRREARNKPTGNIAKVLWGVVITLATLLVAVSTGALNLGQIWNQIKEPLNINTPMFVPFDPALRHAMYYEPNGNGQTPGVPAVAPLPVHTMVAVNLVNDGESPIEVTRMSVFVVSEHGGVAPLNVPPGVPGVSGQIYYKKPNGDRAYFDMRQTGFDIKAMSGLAPHSDTKGFIFLVSALPSDAKWLRFVFTDSVGKEHKLKTSAPKLLDDWKFGSNVESYGLYCIAIGKITSPDGTMIRQFDKNGTEKK